MTACLRSRSRAAAYETWPVSALKRARTHIVTEGDELVERLPAIAAEHAREDAVDALAGEVERRDDAARHLGMVAEREQADGLE